MRQNGALCGNGLKRLESIFSINLEEHFNLIRHLGSKTTSDWLDNLAKPIRGCVTFKFQKSWRITLGMFLRKAVELDLFLPEIVQKARR